MSILRVLLGVVFGFLIGLFVTAAVDGMGNMIAPPPPGVNLTDPGVLRTAMPMLPVQAKIAMVLGWFLGTLSAASTANIIAGRRRAAGLIVGAGFLGLLGFSAYGIGYPAWMTAVSFAASLFAIYTADRAFGRPKTA